MVHKYTDGKLDMNILRETAEKCKNWGKWGPDDEAGTLCSVFYTRRKGKESCFRTRHDGFGYRTDQGYKLMPLGF